MTFLELEKKCRRKKVFKTVKYILFLVLIFAVLFSLYYFLEKNSKKIQNRPVLNMTKKHKTVKKKNKNSNKTKKTLKKTPKARLKLIIDLNISKPVSKISAKMSKEKPKKTEKSAVEKTAPVIKTQTLPSYSTCIALSEKYYNDGDYANALKWAKNANIQNNKNPESWIMSAKALYKMGKKDEAVKILKIYYNYHKDEKIKKLMGELNEDNK